MNKYFVGIIILFLLAGCQGEDNRQEQPHIDINKIDATHTDLPKDSIVIDSAASLVAVEFKDYTPLVGNQVVTDIPSENEVVPIEKLETFLYKNIALIPDTPELGGQFFIVQTTKVKDNLFLVNYEDGHKGGYLLLSTLVNKEKKLIIQPLKVKKY